MSKSIILRTYAIKEGFEESLALRPIAKSIYNQALIDIGSILPDDIIDCVFTGIEMCDVSFSDEFIVNFQRKILEVDNTLLRIIDANEYVQENIEGALALRNKKDKTKICLLLFTNGLYCVLGDIEKNLQETFSLLNAGYQITARDVAQRFSIEINSASNRLKKLFDLRLVQRMESIDETGRQHIYYLPKPE
ncbi:MAG: hypothetical protein PHE09_02420 [Oscillospiraceae bacterium]|nr:hypothetical protein [Oscillospiraceae bacterium]